MKVKKKKNPIRVVKGTTLMDIVARRAQDLGATEQFWNVLSSNEELLGYVVDEIAKQSNIKYDVRSSVSGYPQGIQLFCFSQTCRVKHSTVIQRVKRLGIWPEESRLRDFLKDSTFSSRKRAEKEIPNLVNGIVAVCDNTTVFYIRYEGDTIRPKFSHIALAKNKRWKPGTLFAVLTRLMH